MTGEQYVACKGWLKARLDSCPFDGEDACGLCRHGSYARVKPAGIRVTRYYCPRARTTISLLPDFLAARLSGELDEVERVVCGVEKARSVEAAANELRTDDVGLPGAVRWVRRRLGPVRAALLILVNLMPDRLGRDPRLSSLRQRLGTEHALVQVRELCRERLAQTPAPIGFLPRYSGITPDPHRKRGQTPRCEPGRLPPVAAKERSAGVT
jgi:hypothetical protein